MAPSIHPVGIFSSLLLPFVFLFCFFVFEIGLHVVQASLRFAVTKNDLELLLFLTTPPHTHTFILTHNAGTCAITPAVLGVEPRAWCMLGKYSTS